MTTPESDSPFQPKRTVEGSARSALAEIKRFFSKERLEDAAKRDERSRLARELHDGILQALTGAALQLEALAQLEGTDPRAASQRLHEIAQLIADEQRTLRTWIQAVNPPSAAAMATSTDLGNALRTLCVRIERQSS